MPKSLPIPDPSPAIESVEMPIVDGPATPLAGPKLGAELDATDVGIVGS